MKYVEKNLKNTPILRKSTIQIEFQTVWTIKYSESYTHVDYIKSWSTINPEPINSLLITLHRFIYYHKFEQN